MRTVTHRSNAKCSSVSPPNGKPPSNSPGPPLPLTRPTSPSPINRRSRIKPSRRRARAPRRRDSSGHVLRRLAPRPMRRSHTTHFTVSLSRTAPGGRLPITATFGNRSRRSVRAIGALTAMGAGPTPTLVGRGFRKSRSVGRLITTAAGRVCGMSAGFGCRGMNGRPPGSLGGRVMSTSAGPLCRRKRISIGIAGFRNGLTAIMISMQTNTFSCRIKRSARSNWSAKPSRWSRTSRS